MTTTSETKPPRVDQAKRDKMRREQADIDRWNRWLIRLVQLTARYQKLDAKDTKWGCVRDKTNAAHDALLAHLAEFAEKATDEQGKTFSERVIRMFDVAPLVG